MSSPRLIAAASSQRTEQDVRAARDANGLSRAIFGTDTFDASDPFSSEIEKERHTPYLREHLASGASLSDFPRVQPTYSVSEALDRAIGAMNKSQMKEAAE